MRAFYKKGDAAAMQAGFIAIGLILALVVSGSFIKKTVDDVNGTTFEKNYLAREIALSLDAIYASPAKVEYTFSMRQYSFIVEFRNSSVFVKDDICDQDGISGFYDYYDSLGDDPNGYRLSKRITPTGTPEQIMFTKKADDDALSIAVQSGDVTDYNEQACK